VPVNEERAARVVYGIAHAEIHVLQRLDDVEEAANVHVETVRAQLTPEQQNVVGKT
jgi:hypothetical protein